MATPRTAHIRIHYCTLCQWQLRAVWLAQELLNSFTDEIAQVTLQPGSGGVFEIWANGHLVWERKRDGGFPDAKALKRRVRNSICPEKPLGAHLESSPLPQ